MFLCYLCYFIYINLFSLMFSYYYFIYISLFSFASVFPPPPLQLSSPPPYLSNYHLPSFTFSFPPSLLPWPLSVHMYVCTSVMYGCIHQWRMYVCIHQWHVCIHQWCMYVCVCMWYVCMCTFWDVVKRVDLHKNMLFGETSLIKAESLYAYYNAILIQKINFLNM